MKTRIGRGRGRWMDGLSSFFHLPTACHFYSFLLSHLLAHIGIIYVYMYISTHPHRPVVFIVLYVNQTKEMDKMKYSIIWIKKRISFLELLSFPLLFSIERAKREKYGDKNMQRRGREGGRLQFLVRQSSFPPCYV